MLDMKKACETCGKALAPEGDAHICSYECTFCAECTDKVHHHVCPNCKGELKPRPKRANAA